MSIFEIYIYTGIIHSGMRLFLASVYGSKETKKVLTTMPASMFAINVFLEIILFPISFMSNFSKK